MQHTQVIGRSARRNTILRRAAATAVIGLVAGTQAQAATTHILMLQGGSTWTDSLWIGGPMTAPTNNPGDIVNFSGITGGARQLDVDVTIGQIQNNVDANFELTPHENDYKLTLDNTGGTTNPLGNNRAFLGTLGTGSIRLGVNVVINGDLDISTATGTVEMTSGTSITGTGNIYIRKPGNNSITLSNVQNAGAIEYVGSQTGLLQLNGVMGPNATTFTIKSGTVRAGTTDGQFGSAQIILGDTSGSEDVTLQARGLNPNDIIVRGGNTGTVKLMGIHGSGPGSFSGTITLENHDLVLDFAEIRGTVTGTGNVIWTNRNISSTSTAVFNNVGALILNSDQSGQLGFGGSIGANVTQIVQNSPTLTFNLAGNNVDFAGSVFANVGTVQASSNTALNANNVVHVNAGATFRISNHVTIAGLVDGTDGGGSVIGTGYTLTIGGSGTYVFSGSRDATGPLVKTGTGTQIFTGHHVYTGATTINGGALIVDGSLGQTTVTVNEGGTLGGSGAIGGPTTVKSGGILSPGSSPGTLTFLDNLTLNNGAILLFEAGDLVTVEGTLDLDDNWTLALGDGFKDGGSVVLFQYGQLAGSPDLEPTFDLSALGFVPSSSLSLVDTGSQIILNGVSVVPEPTGLALLAGAAGLMVRRRRVGR